MKVSTTSATSCPRRTEEGRFSVAAPSEPEMRRVVQIMADAAGVVLGESDDAFWRAHYETVIRHVLAALRRPLPAPEVTLCAICNGQRGASAHALATLRIGVLEYALRALVDEATLQAQTAHCPYCGADCGDDHDYVVQRRDGPGGRWINVHRRRQDCPVVRGRAAIEDVPPEKVGPWPGESGQGIRIETAGQVAFRIRDLMMRFRLGEWGSKDNWEVDLSIGANLLVWRSRVGFETTDAEAREAAAWARAVEARLPEVAQRDEADAAIAEGLSKWLAGDEPWKDGA